MRKRLAAAASLLIAASPAASASAAPKFHSCAGDIPGECATLTVPLDRSSGMPGTVHLAIRRTTFGEHSSRAVLAIAGGPGQSAIDAYANEGYVGTLGPVLNN